MDRDEALALLRDNHEFPGSYTFRVVVRREATTSTVSAMVAAAGESAQVVAVVERESRKGTYKALHVDMKVDDAERVLDVYEVLRQLDAVLTTL